MASQLTYSARIPANGIAITVPAYIPSTKIDPYFVLLFYYKTLKRLNIFLFWKIFLKISNFVQNSLFREKMAMWENQFTSKKIYFFSNLNLFSLIKKNWKLYFKVFLLSLENFQRIQNNSRKCCKMNFENQQTCIIDKPREAPPFELVVHRSFSRQIKKFEKKFFV